MKLHLSSLALMVLSAACLWGCGASTGPTDPSAQRDQPGTALTVAVTRRSPPNDGGNYAPEPAFVQVDVFDTRGVTVGVSPIVPIDSGSATVQIPYVPGGSLRVTALGYSHAEIGSEAAFAYGNANLDLVAGTPGTVSVDLVPSRIPTYHGILITPISMSVDQLNAAATTAVLPTGPYLVPNPTVYAFR